MKRILRIMLLLIIFITALSLLVLNQPIFGKTKVTEKIKNSKNWDGKQFKNLEPTPSFAENVNAFTVFWDFFFGPKDPLLNPKNSIPHLKSNLSDLSDKQLIWLGHSSYIFKLNGKVFLVDPVLSGSASPVPNNILAFKGANEYQISDLPDIDFLVISHDHYDHLDYKTIKAIQPKIKKVITGLGVGEHFRYWGFELNLITELDWYEQTNIETFKITSTPARHFSGRTHKRNSTLWSSFVIETLDFKLFIGGDSGYGKHFKTIGNEFGPFDLAILENGQYNKYWKYIHTLPHELMQVSKDLQARAILPVHSAKFALAKHAWNEPLELAYQNAINANITIYTPKIGQTLNMADTIQTFQQWWRD